MKKTLATVVFAAAIALFATACSWNPSVAEVPITAPWDKMSLPVKEDARVWTSNDKTLKVVHKAGRVEVAKSYSAALEKDGWKLTAQPDMAEHSYTYNYEKGGQKIEVEIYDFENTGVIIEKK